MFNARCVNRTTTLCMQRQASCSHQLATILKSRNALARCQLAKKVERNVLVARGSCFPSACKAFAVQAQGRAKTVFAKMGNAVPSLYEDLGLSRAATDTEIRRAFRNLVTRYHPDKGGDPEKFARIKQAHDVLGNPAKRSKYDQTGEVARTVQEEFLDSFGEGTFNGWSGKPAPGQAADMSEQIAIRTGETQPQSFTAGFEAWMRGRGDAGTNVFTADSIAEQYGVVKGTYDAVPLPKVKVNMVHCTGAGDPREQTECTAQSLPRELAWGQVLVSMRAAPINPGDLHAIRTGGTYGSDSVSPPFVAGMDGVGVIMKVGEGVTGVREGEWVLPFKPHMGTWRSLAVCRAADLLTIPAEVLSIEHAALAKQLCLAYRLLEECRGLKPGDCVVLNAANSTVGQIVVQLCRVLQLRCVALVRRHATFEQTRQMLQALGATEVFADEGSIKVQLEARRFFARPKLALDAVGGASAARLADTLAEGREVIVYGCSSGQPPAWPWQAFVFSRLQARGFNLRAWMGHNRAKVGTILESCAKLLDASKLQVVYTEYELASEFHEALEHAMEGGINTKVLKMTDIGETY